MGAPFYNQNNVKPLPIERRFSYIRGRRTHQVVCPTTNSGRSNRSINNCLDCQWLVHFIEDVGVLCNKKRDTT
jgi:hypothetical protein